ncbi:helix-turn-helix transcriptional regulator [Nocardioides dongkuii]|uniref:helix-turn-helix transcriptional regulator n=1 Tax=Nocardioides dongkuii TaxID=2760089 RepID=UPI0015F7EAF9|nr:LuxR C-terminal-related transcriptional regulator [Nocardioides dongkuii]
MGPDRPEGPNNRRPGSHGARESGAASRARAAEDRSLRSDAQDDAADDRERAADARDAEQDVRELEQDARERGMDDREAQDARDRVGAAAHLDALPPRQREIIEMIADGMSNKAIADRLFISPDTVKTHIRALYARIGVVSRTQAVHWYEHGPRRSD